MNIRLIKESECKQVADMIYRSVQNSAFTKFYPKCSIEYIGESLNEEGVKARASWTHFYVIEEDEKIVACGAIGSYYGSETESSLFTIFVDPDYQGKGYGRKMIETLEKDEYFLRADRIEIPASMSAIPFYRKFGYEHKNGELIFSDGHFALEKYRNKIEKSNPNKKFLGTKVKVKMDRPLGSKHPKHGFVYPVNYGYIPNTISGDGEELDAYVLGEHKPLDEFEGEVIAIIHRLNDDDDKLVVMAEGGYYSDEQIRALTEFQEKFFKSEIIR